VAVDWLAQRRGDVDVDVVGGVAIAAAAADVQPSRLDMDASVSTPLEPRGNDNRLIWPNTRGTQHSLHRRAAKSV
jgi:hypothetical protein